MLQAVLRGSDLELEKSGGAKGITWSPESQSTHQSYWPLLLPKVSSLLSVATFPGVALRLPRGMEWLSTLCSGTARSLSGEAHLCDCLASEQGAFPFSQKLLYRSCADHLSPKHCSLPEINHVRRGGFSATARSCLAAW